MESIVSLLKNNWKIILITLIALILRFHDLGNLPAGFHGDEASYGYNAYSILKTGADEYGIKFPLIFKAFEDYKPGVYVYLDVPFIALLGLTEFATRFPSALFGTLTIPLIYLITKKLFNNKRIAILSSILLAILPWHINLSRTTSEVVVSVFFILLLFYGLMIIQNKHKFLWWLVSVLSASLAFASYTASRFFVPIVIGIFFLFTIKKVGKKIVWSLPVLTVLLTIICLELIYGLVASTQRFDQVNIFSHPETKLLLEEQIREAQFVPPFITRIFSNKAVSYGKTIISNYSGYFTLDFLVLNGGLPKRQQIPSTGLFYLCEVPFLILGVIAICMKKSKSGFLTITLWLALIFPAALTFDDIPNVYRTLVIVPFVVIIMAIGIDFIAESLPKKFVILFAIILGLFLVYEFSYYQFQYIVRENKHQPWYRNFASRGLVHAINEYYPKYKKIIITKEETMSYIHILFFDKYDPIKYQKSGSNMDKDGTGFGKYVFNSAECPLYAGKYGDEHIKGSTDILYVNSGTCVTPIFNGRLLKTIYWGDGTPAFKLVQYVPNP